MTTGEALLAAQRARFVAVDPLLPEPAGPPSGETLTAATAGGDQVVGLLQTRTHQPGSLDLLWSAARVWQLFPFVGATGTEGMDALLRAWRHRMDAESPPADSSCSVTWPSHDAEAIHAFLDHGMVPISTLALRTEPPPPRPEGDLVIRQAGPEDFEETLALTAQTFAYTALVGFGRPGAEELITPQLRRNLAAGAPIWLAERDGVAIAVADCGWVTSAPGTWAAELLPPGTWGYVNNVATAAGWRGRGVGRALMAVVHREFHRMGATGTYLYYTPTNPLASVFWPRQGYRPLWTYWEVRPASALR
ncbi:MAG TPA: GNAT family N-acetyltransferase [Amycolatopsis sp.]|uniref:GNAT family N-acetyltransferase n=1 Tax=Amycolatopsis sp. TaxID=37632 RepID=UPI002B4995E8|nr:GNAT family N-acetyltransferase [Amycolatopsis sp.]HKS49045.1 GNAT family N-acetyltransferase [Amycolatopsis sp.]